MRSTLAATLLVATLAGPVAACMWDYDTLEMERRRFPEALELITGKFLRHSYEFYRWRVEDRLARIEDDPENPALYDDLAVAYDKIGEHANAIETIGKIEAFAPGRYETAANLGTFHIHAGDLETGLEHLRRAVEINPDAHFGREVYQILLVEYVLSKRAEDGSRPQPLDDARTRSDDDSPYYEPHGFGAFVLEERGIAPEDTDARNAEIKRALKGVFGMMRFGKYDSPVLLEAAGDLLTSHWNEDAKRLGTRTYLRAADVAETDEAREAFRNKARSALVMQVESRENDDQMTLDQIESQLADEMAEAEAWYGEVAANEQRWIDAGLDVDAKFTETYYEEPTIGATGADPVSLNGLTALPFWTRVAIAGGLVLAVLAVVVVGIRRRSMLTE